MNTKFTVALIAIVVVVGVGGAALYMHETMIAKVAAEVQPVSETTPVQAIKGKEATMSLTNHQTAAAEVTIPGIQNTPTPVASGASAQVHVVAQTPGTYPIVETVMVPNTNSIDGGTVPAEYEVGHVVVSD